MSATIKSTIDTLTNNQIIKKKKERCSNINCNKRIKSMFIMVCKCGAKFCCNSHIIPYEEHKCSFDFTKEQKELLSTKLTMDFTSDNTKMNRI
jgi:hypothetical protein